MFYNSHQFLKKYVSILLTIHNFYFLGIVLAKYLVKLMLKLVKKITKNVTHYNKNFSFYHIIVMMNKQYYGSIILL